MTLVTDFASDFYVAIKNKYTQNIIYQLFLEVYKRSEKFKYTFTYVFENINAKYITIQNFRFVSNYSNNCIPVLESFFASDKMEVSTMFALAYSDEKYRENILNLIKNSKLSDFDKLL